MKIKINRELLFPALLACSSVVEKRQTIPILANLLLIQNNGFLHITGSNLEVEVTKTLELPTSGDCELTLSAEKLVEICRTLPAGCDITIKVETNKVVLTAAKSRFTLQSLPASDFPKLKATDFQERFALPVEAFKQILEATAFSMATQDVRIYLNGLLLEVNNNRLVAVATDGHRLSKSEVILDEGQSPDKHQIIIPRKAIQEILRLLVSFEDNEASQSKSKQSVKLEFNNKHLQITTADTVITSSLINGQFPEYETILLADLDKTICINRQHLLETLARTAILTNTIRHGVRLHFTESNKLEVSTNNTEQEAAEDELPCVYDGEKITTSFNVKYLIEALKVIDTNDVVLHIKDKDSVCLLEKPDDLLSSWLVMPMRL